MSEATPQNVAPPRSSRGDRVIAVLALLCLALVVFFAKSTESTLPATDAATHADLAMNATAHGWIPHLPLSEAAKDGHWGVSGYNDHPFLFFSISGAVMRALGPDGWSAKLVPCLFSVGCVMVLFFSRARFFGRQRLACLQELILVVTRPFIIDGLNAHPGRSHDVFHPAFFPGMGKRAALPCRDRRRHGHVV